MFRKILTILALIIFSVALGFAFLRYLLPFELPNEPNSTIILDTKGKEIGEALSRKGSRHRPLDIQEIPEFYKKALIATEDASFNSNIGIDILAIARATFENLRAGRVTQGGSTLSMGLVRNSLWRVERRSMPKKIAEAAYAIRLNGKFSKDHILAEYINRIDYGRLSIGLASAAKSYFAKNANELTKAECLALITIGKNSTLYHPIDNPEVFRKQFQQEVEFLVTKGVLSREESTAILSEKLSFPKPRAELPYVTDFIKSEMGAGRLEDTSSDTISTTFDLAMTEEAERNASSVLDAIAWRNVSDYAVLIADRETHEVRVMIGGANYASSQAGQVNSVLAKRQVGSTIKPFTYLLAFQKFGYLPADTVLDLPVAFETAEGTSYEPKNYSLDFRGEMSYAEALAQSVNVPAVRLANKIGTKELLSFLHTIGMDSLDRDADYYGLSLTLGSGELSLYELLRAYSVFSWHGTYCGFSYTKNAAPAPCKQISEQKYTDMIESILTNRSYKLPQFPAGSALDFPDRFAFVKTGTSRNFRDNWAIGYTNHFLIGVWSGNKDGENMKWVSGATGAGEIFGRLVRSLEGEGGAPSETITAAKNPTNSKPFLEITSPLVHSIFEIRPNVPQRTQQIQLTLQTNIIHERAEWQLDDVPLTETLVGIAKLTPGIHKIAVQLLDSKGAVIGSKETLFEIRQAEK